MAKYYLKDDGWYCQGCGKPQKGVSKQSRVKGFDIKYCKECYEKNSK